MAGRIKKDKDMTQNKKIEEVIEKFEERFGIANFTWNGNPETGLEFAQKSRKDIKSFIRRALKEAKESAEFELDRLQEMIYRNEGRIQGRKETLEECLEIINHSIDKTDAYKEINDKLK